MMARAENTDLANLPPNPFEAGGCAQDLCLTCGLCAGACPISGIDGFDPRKLVRMAMLGYHQDLTASRWPWICTLCGRCENLCPMDIHIPNLIRQIRGLRARANVPGILHKGLVAALETGNNLRLPQEDFEFILQDVAEEIQQESGFENFTVSIDKKGANLLTTIHNKLVNTHTEDLKYWWKIFYAAGEDWTVPSENWEGTNWAYFTGDETSMRTMTGRIVEQMRRLEVHNLMWPE